MVCSGSGFSLSLLWFLQGLSDPNNYHEFCRLLARLKSNYQLGELVKVDNYPDVIMLIAEFTVNSLQVNVSHDEETWMGERVESYAWGIERNLRYTASQF